MAGFRYVYSLYRTTPLVQDVVSADAALAVGDFVNLEAGATYGEADLAVTTDAALMGAVIAPSNPDGSLASLTAGTTKVRVITNPDAVYEVTDLNARKKGALLDIAGATGAQGVAASSNNEFIVVEDSTATEPTKVMIATTKAWTN